RDWSSDVCSSDLGGADTCLGTVVAEQPGDQYQVLGSGQFGVHRRVLAGQPDQAAYLVWLFQHVEPAHDGMPLVGSQQGGENAHGRGLTGPVGAQYAQYGPCPDGQVDPVQGTFALELLDQTFRVDGVGHRFFGVPRIADRGAPFLLRIGVAVVSSEPDSALVEHGHVRVESMGVELTALLP